LGELRGSPGPEGIGPSAPPSSALSHVLRPATGLRLAVVGGIAFVYFLSYPLALGGADESHLLFEARRVFEGQVPYKDFFESLTPLSFYLFAGVYWIAGTFLLPARVTIAVIEAVGCALLFHLVRRLASGLEAALAALILAGLCVPVWPFASPHWISTTLGLAVATVVLSRRWQGSERVRPLAAGLLAGASFCTQQQRGVFLVLWLPAAFSILVASRPRGTRWRALITQTVWAACGTASVVLVVLGYAVSKASLATFIDMAFGFAVNHYGPTQSGIWGWAAVVPIAKSFAAPTWLWLLRVSPMFPLAEGAFLLRRPRRNWQRHDLESACLCVLAVLMAGSVWYLPDFIHVAFVLPFLIIPGVTVLYRLRSALWWTRVPRGRQAVTVAVVLFALAVAAQSIANVPAAYRAAPVSLETDFGTIRVDSHMEQLFRAVRAHLVAEPSGRPQIYSFPNDAWLYLTLPADNVTPYSLLAARMFPPEDFASVVDVLRTGRAGTVVLITPLASGRVGGGILGAVEQGYDLVDEVKPYRIYVRHHADRPSAADGAQ